MSAPANTTEGIGLVVALPAEARSLGARGVRPGDCVRWQRGWIAISGIGHHNAQRAAECLLERGVSALANWGVAGALVASLVPGDVLIPDRIRYADDDAHDFIPDADSATCLVRQLTGGILVHRGTLWSASQAVTGMADKRALADRTGAVAVDMEAAAVAAVAIRARLPFVALKAVCDPLNRAVPARIARKLDGNGGVSIAMLSAIVCGGPATWRAARLLARDFAQARHSLALAARLAALPA